MSKPPKIVIPGLNRGAGIPGGYILGRRRGSKQGPAELLNLTQLRGIGIATTTDVTSSTSLVQSIAHSETVSLSRSVSASLSALSGSLSGAVSSTSSLSSAVSTVISGSISVVNSRIDSLSTAGTGGVTTFLALTDTPANYTGAANKAVTVNAAETALEFTVPAGGTGQSTSLSQISSSLSGTISTNVLQSTSLSQVSSSLSGVISTNVIQSTSLSQISSSLSGAISSTTSLSGAVSTVDTNQSTSISINLSMINSLSTAIGGGGGGGASWIPLVTGAEPPVFVTDGAGVLILVASS